MLDFGDVSGSVPAGQAISTHAGPQQAQGGAAVWAAIRGNKHQIRKAASAYRGRFGLKGKFGASHHPKVSAKPKSSTKNYR